MFNKGASDKRIDRSLNQHRAISGDSGFNLIFGVFIILIIFIFIQTFSSSIREKDEIYEKIITERKQLMQLASTILISADYNFFNSHKKQIVTNMASSSDIVFCRIVYSSGEIYLSSIENEIGKLLDVSNLSSKETTVKKDFWKGEEIEIMITPTFRGYSLWLGYNYSIINSAIKQMIINQVSVAFVLTTICILVYVLLARSNSKARKNQFRSRVLNFVLRFIPDTDIRDAESIAGNKTLPDSVKKNVEAEKVIKC